MTSRFEQDLTLWGCRTVQDLMPDKEELLGDTRSVTVQEHKWYRGVIGMMCYSRQDGTYHSMLIWQHSFWRALPRGHWQLPEG